IVNSILDILKKNKGEILDKRMEELLKKEFPFMNPLLLEELLMRLESMGIINVFRVSKSKKMVVFNKYNQEVKDEFMEDLT
ncbi:MAG: hypothetical protein ACFFBY_11850, partial [Promethearchaeota archaeon]